MPLRGASTRSSEHSAGHRLVHLTGQLVLLIAGTLVGLLLAEWLVRAFGSVPIVPQMFVSDPHTAYRSKPGVSERAVWPGVFDWRWTINAQGFRGSSEFSVPKPPGVRRVLALGDSFTFGFGVNDDQTYPAYLQARLAAACAGDSIEVINGGVSAFSTSQELAFLEHYGLRLEPDVILVGFFVNDPEDNLDKGVHDLQNGTLVSVIGETAPSAYAGASTMKRLANALPGYEALVRRSALVNWLRRTYFSMQMAAVRDPAAPARWGQAEPRTPAPEPSASRTAAMWELMHALFGRFREIASEHDARLGVLLIPSDSVLVLTRAGRADLAAPMPHMHQLCQQQGLDCIDIASRMLERDPHLSIDRLFIPREGHFSAEGNRRTAEVISAPIAELLACDAVSPASAAGGPLGHT